MVNFFKSIFNWIVENKDNIILFFTSTNFVTIVCDILLHFKRAKRNKNAKSNTDANNVEININELVKNTKYVSDTKAEIDNLKKLVKNDIDVVCNKLNAVIKVQSLVYSSLKDDIVRDNVQKTLMSAESLPTSGRVELENDIEELTNTIRDKVADVQEAVNKVSSKKLKKDVSRY